MSAPVTADIRDENPDRITASVQVRHKEQARSIPGSRFDHTTNTWSFPLTWSSCLTLRAVFGADLSVGDRLNAWAREHKANVVTPVMAKRELFELPGQTHDTLFPHQMVDVEVMTTARKMLLINDPGCGKSLSTIWSLKTLKEQGEDVFPCLVICPSSVKTSWKREFERWWPEVAVQVVSGSAVQRKRQIESGADVLVMNYESVRSHSRLAPYGSLALRRCPACGGEDDAVTAAKCQVHIKSLNEIEFRSVVADEAHRLKDPTSQNSRAALSAAGDAQIRFGLTGTPIGNSLIDLWSLLHFIDPEQWGNKTKWTERNLEIMYNTWGGVVMCSLRPEREAEFRGAVDPHMRRVPLDAVVQNLPDYIHERRDVPMTPKQTSAYNAMADRLMASLESGLLVASSPLTATLRLQQLASSYGELTDDGSGEEKLILTAPSSKIDAFMSDIDDFEGRSVVVFAVSRQLIDMLSTKMDAKGIPHGKITGTVSEVDRQLAIDDFQAGRTKFILITIAAGGAGITLTKGSVCVMLQRSWSMIEHKQALARCRRIGSEIHDSLLHVDYIAPDTIEEAVLAALEDKGATLETLVRDADLMKKAIRGEVDR